MVSQSEIVSIGASPMDFDPPDDWNISKRVRHLHLEAGNTSDGEPDVTVLIDGEYDFSVEGMFSFTVLEVQSRYLRPGLLSFQWNRKEKEPPAPQGLCPLDLLIGANSRAIQCKLNGEVFPISHCVLDLDADDSPVRLDIYYHDVTVNRERMLSGVILPSEKA